MKGRRPGGLRHVLCPETSKKLLIELDPLQQRTANASQETRVEAEEGLENSSTIQAKNMAQTKGVALGLDSTD